MPGAVQTVQLLNNLFQAVVVAVVLLSPISSSSELHQDTMKVIPHITYHVYQHQTTTLYFCRHLYLPSSWPQLLLLQLMLAMFQPLPMHLLLHLTTLPLHTLLLLTTLRRCHQSHSPTSTEELMSTEDTLPRLRLRMSSALSRVSHDYENDQRRHCVVQENTELSCPMAEFRLCPTTLTMRMDSLLM